MVKITSNSWNVWVLSNECKSCENCRSQVVFSALRFISWHPSVHTFIQCDIQLHEVPLKKSWCSDKRIWCVCHSPEFGNKGRMWPIKKSLAQVLIMIEKRKESLNNTRRWLLTFMAWILFGKAFMSSFGSVLSKSQMTLSAQVAHSVQVAHSGQGPLFVEP